jgi:dihydrofolate reductase
MITGHGFIATSLDGFIARPDGDIGWLLSRTDPAEDHGYDAFIADKDVILMGRGTFETVRGFTPWPYEKPVVVLSSTLCHRSLPECATADVRILDVTPSEVMHLLEAEGFRRVYVDGGRVIQSFLQAGLIADMVITVVPVLLGQGRRLFGPLPQDVALVHEATQSFPSGLVQSRYRVVR